MCLIQYLLYNIFTVHDTENLTFPRNSVVVPRRHLQIVVPSDVDLPHRQAQIFCADGLGSSMQIRVENGGNQKANFNAEGLRMTSQGSFEL